MLDENHASFSLRNYYLFIFFLSYYIEGYGVLTNDISETEVRKLTKYF